MNERISYLFDKAKLYFIDGTAQNLFYGPFMAFNEVQCGRMSVDDMISNRISISLSNYLFGPTYGYIRKGWARLTKTTRDSSRFRKVLVESSALVFFGFGQYALVSALDGRSGEEIMRAAPFSIALCLSTGRPFGIFNDWLRHKTKCETVLRKESLEDRL